MSNTLVFGHKNPDTDSICSALAYASLKRQLGVDAEAVRLGEVNKETAFVLDYANINAPRFIEKVEQSVEQVILVDHNEFQQSVDNIKDVNIAEVIDHHRIANFETSNPVYFRAEPVGCTSTILYKLFKENKATISKEDALLMISAIISDTLLFKSPTCTEEDVAAAEAMAEIAEIDLQEYGLQMLKAGTDLQGRTVSELLGMDAKEFTMNSSKVEIAQINVIEYDTIFSKQADYEAEIEKIIAEKELDLYLLVVTNILDNDSDVLALGSKQENVERAFSVVLQNNRALLEGVVSRKKQIVTNLEDSFNGVESKV